MFIATLSVGVPKWTQAKGSSADEWIDKIVISTCYWAIKKEQGVKTCSSMDKPLKHYAKWSKTVTKSHVSCDSTFVKCLD